MGKILLSVMALLLTASCTVPESRIYSIYMPAPASAVHDKDALSAAVSVSSPKYLAQPYMACRNSPYQVEIAKYSKWESSPEDIVRDTFKDHLLSAGLFKEVRTSYAVPEGLYRLRINLKRFEKYYEGDVAFGEIAFELGFISPEGKELFHGTVSKKVRLEDKTFLALAKGLSSAFSEALAEVDRDIASALGRH